MQCDTCEQWFHLLCVGLGQQDVADDEDYVCHTCKAKPAKPKVKKTAKGPPPAKPKVTHGHQLTKLKVTPDPPLTKPKVTVASELMIKEEPLEVKQEAEEKSEERVPYEECSPTSDAAQVVDVKEPEEVPGTPADEASVVAEEQGPAVEESMAKDSPDPEAEPKHIEFPPDKNSHSENVVVNTEVEPEEMAAEQNIDKDNKQEGEEVQIEVPKEKIAPAPLMRSPPVTPNRASLVTPVLEKLAALPGGGGALALTQPSTSGVATDTPQASVSSQQLPTTVSS